jgi:transposase
MEPPMRKPKRRKPLNDLSRCPTALNVNETLIAVIELSQKTWLVAGIIPGIERQPLKKLEPDENALLSLLDRWRKEAEKAGYKIKRVAVAFEAGRDGFWLARWLRARGIEAHVIHASSVAVPREHRRAKTDRLDTELLKRAFLGWLRGEREHCKMAAIPTIAEEDARRPSRERESLVGEQNRIINRMKAALARLGIRGFNPKLEKAADHLEDLRTPEGEPIPPNTLSELRRDMERRRFVMHQIRQIEAARLERLKQATRGRGGSHAMVRLLARVKSISVETADMLVHEALSRNLRDRRAVARYAGLTGSPEESGSKRREKGLARSGNIRVRRGMIQLAWRFLMFQKDSALARWYRTRTDNVPGSRKKMIVALARKLLIALWQFVRDGVVPEGFVLRPAQ